MNRFYGTSLPLGQASFQLRNMKQLFNPQQVSILFWLEHAVAPTRASLTHGHVLIGHGTRIAQALADTAYFLQTIRESKGCADEPRCPVITVGGSYPGWLSAMMRLRYPAVVDIAYAASAPMRFYSQQVGEYAYYQKVTQSAEAAVPGCGGAVRSGLDAVRALPNKSEAVKELNLCSPLPAYLQGDDAATTKLFFEELTMVVMYTFADLNMGNYPPPNTPLRDACRQAVAAGGGVAVVHDLLHNFAAASPLRHRRVPLVPPTRRTGRNLPNHAVAGAPGASGCYNLSSQLPSGPNATISSGDWSGVGAGANGESWDFQTCTFLVEAIGTNGETDMFPPRNWTLAWLEDHCRRRFGVIPQPRALADLWGFDALQEAGASRIIFTNGMTDGWSAGGITADISPTLVAINIKDGAHHSDLSHQEPSSADTPAVVSARQRGLQLLRAWLKDLSFETVRVE